MTASKIRRLPSFVVERIAAGEVIDRPASVVKELVENALDAHARSITLRLLRGGKQAIEVIDDGDGMSGGDLVLSLERHATSKLEGDDVFSVRTLGFRGEALASIGAVASLQIDTRREKSDHGWSISMDYGVCDDIKPCSTAKGTRVLVESLFGKVPARKAFLRSDGAEKAAVIELVRRLALTRTDVTFRLEDEKRKVLNFEAPDPTLEGGSDEDRLQKRIAQVLGTEFTENSVTVSAEREGFRVWGKVSLPTYHRANGMAQHVIVNGRVLRDRFLLGAVRGGYADLLASGRFPVVVLFVAIDPDAVDVNVHPTKNEVRFRDPSHVRGLIVSALRDTLRGHLGTSTTLSERLSTAFSQAPMARGSFSSSRHTPAAPHPRRTSISSQGIGSKALRDSLAPPSVPIPETTKTNDAQVGEDAQAISLAPEADPTTQMTAQPVIDAEFSDKPLGRAVGQVHSNYVISESKEGLYIIDQHAAHERLVYESLLRSIKDNKVERQILLVPEVVSLDADAIDRLLEHKEMLAQFGLVFEAFGPGAITISEVPSLLRKARFSELMRDLADEVQAQGSADLLEKRVNEVASRMACHRALRSGRLLKHEEMNVLLREIESHPESSQCNHGRPSYVFLGLDEIEKLFGRR